ncbi:sterol desaturase family protein, partial [bacterium]
FHQLHHSSRRLDVSASLIFHPLDTASYTAIVVLVNVFVLGIHPLAAALAGVFMSFNAFFQHWNVRTPVWLGYILQRPESHCLHHEKGVHGRNYSDIPLWDMLFGTFENPREFAGEVGFEPEASRRVGAMLATMDVNKK